MKKIIAGIIVTASLLITSIPVSAEDVVVIFTAPERNCPAIDTQYVTQFWASPNTCTRIYHR